MAADRPFILSFFSTPPRGERGHLYYLDEERQALEQIFKPLKTRLIYDAYNEDITVKMVSEALRANWESYTIIHYSGHADAFRLSLAEEQLNADNFIDLVSKCKKLDLIILNGCSTQGFVKKLLNSTTARAVIATPRPVNDQTARNFSEEFYKNLVEDLPLELSFIGALAAVLGGSYKPDSNIFKLNRKDGSITGMELISSKKQGAQRTFSPADAPLMDDNAATAWGLYVADDFPLDWQLFTSTDEASKFRAQKNAERVRIEADIIAKQNDEVTQKMVLDTLDKNSLQYAHVKAFIETCLKGIANELQILQQDLKRVKADLNNYSLEAADDEAISKFEEYIKRFNFNKQKTFIADLDDRCALGKVAGFVLHGNTDCCMHQLLRNVLQWLGISVSGKSIFDMDAVLQENNYWEKLRTDLQLRSSSEPESVIKSLHARYRDEDGFTQNSFAILFRNSDTDLFARAEFRKKVFDFWREFTTQFSLQDQGQSDNVEHRIFLFLVDDQCQVVKGRNGFTCARETDYSVSMMDSQLEAARNWIMPVVQPVKQSEITQWQIENAIPAGYRFSKQDISAIIKKTEGYLLPTIKYITTEKIKTPARKDRAYLSFLSSIKNPF